MMDGMEIAAWGEAALTTERLAEALKVNEQLAGQTLRRLGVVSRFVPADATSLARDT